MIAIPTTIPGLLDHRADVPLAGVLPHLGITGKIPNLADAQSPHIHNRTKSFRHDFWQTARLGWAGNLCDRQPGNSLGGVLVVSKNQKRICRCPLI